jgi:hypothetical protein
MKNNFNFNFKQSQVPSSFYWQILKVQFYMCVCVCVCVCVVFSSCYPLK